MHISLSRCLICLSLLLALLCAGCASQGASPAVRTTSSASDRSPVVPASASSMAHFLFTGSRNASYTVYSSEPTSELRHGHREFTILLSDDDISLFIVFYGYQGPGEYTLSDAVNGGDVHIGLKHNTLSWDLLMQPIAHCSLSVASDTPTSSAGLDRMRGTFSCPLLLSSSPSNPQEPITVRDGLFDIAIQVAS